MSIYYDGEMVSAGSVGEVYSTTETRIGTWIDGKPLYRRVISGSSPNVSNAWTQISTIDKDLTIVHLYGILQGATSRDTFYSVPLYFRYQLGGETYDVNVFLMYTISNGAISCFISGTNFNSMTDKPMHIVVEYTKTKPLYTQLISPDTNALLPEINTKASSTKPIEI